MDEQGAVTSGPICGLEHTIEECSCLGKICTKCEKALCTGHYNKQKGGKNGLNSKCRACCSKENAEWREKNHAYNLQRVREYHQSHKEEDHARNKAWHETNLVYDRERHKRYNRENAERVKQYGKEYKHKNRSTIRERERAYWAKHRERHGVNTKRNYMRHKEARIEQAKRHRQGNIEQIRARERAYNHAHRDQRIMYLKSWRKIHPLYSLERYRTKRAHLGKTARVIIPKVPKTSRIRVQISPEQRAENRRAAWKRYALTHQEYLTQRAREYHKKYPERHSAQQAKRRTMKTQAGGFYTPDEWKALCEKHNYICLACCRSGVQLTADHIIPVFKGGHSYISNIQPLCRPCNSSKGTKIIDYRPA